ncbi:hypothetical protein NMY22_g10081 [Coprinellus aureogranulatus]|nr:hypothetical protein NMY22_g10081 [Coprinellus aureogranulatus]
MHSVREPLKHAFKGNGTLPAVTCSAGPWLAIRYHFSIRCNDYGPVSFIATCSLLPFDQSFLSPKNQQPVRGFQQAGTKLEKTPSTSKIYPTRARRNYYLRHHSTRHVGVDQPAEHASSHPTTPRHWHLGAQLWAQYGGREREQPPPSRSSSGQRDDDSGENAFSMPKILQEAQRLKDRLDRKLAASSSNGASLGRGPGSENDEDNSDLESSSSAYSPSHPSSRDDTLSDARFSRLCDISNRVILPLPKPSSRAQPREKRVKGKSDHKPVRRQHNLRVTWVKTAVGWVILDASMKKGKDGPSQASTCQARFGEDCKREEAAPNQIPSLSLQIPQSALLEPVLFNPHTKANGQKTAFGDYRQYRRALMYTTVGITDGTTTFAAAQSPEQSPATSSSRSVLCGAVGTLWCGWTDDDGRPCSERVIASADTIQQHLEVMHDVKNRNPGEKVRCGYEWCRSSFMRRSSLGAHVLNKHAEY